MVQEALIRQITVAIMRATINVIHFVRIVCTYINKIFDCKSIHYVIGKKQQILCTQKYLQLLIIS